MRRRSKFGNKPTVIDGIRFDSIAESRRYSELKILQNAGHIMQLEIHPRYPLEVNGLKICTYEADFRYYDVERGIQVEDVKGAPLTALYKLKKKLMFACFGIEVSEIR